MPSNPSASAPDPRKQGSGPGAHPDTEIPARPRRRQFTADYKLRVLEEADACRAPGEMGALLRREGLYSSHLAEWRRARVVGIFPTEDSLARVTGGEEPLLLKESAMGSRTTCSPRPLSGGRGSQET